MSAPRPAPGCVPGRGRRTPASRSGDDPVGGTGRRLDYFAVTLPQAFRGHTEADEYLVAGRPSVTRPQAYEGDHVTVERVDGRTPRRWRVFREMGRAAGWSVVHGILARIVATSIASSSSVGVLVGIGDVPFLHLVGRNPRALDTRKFGWTISCLKRPIRDRLGYSRFSRVARSGLSASWVRRSVAATGLSDLTPRRRIWGALARTVPSLPRKSGGAKRTL